MALILIKISRIRGRVTFVQTVISTNAIKADSRGMMFKNRVLLLKKSSLVILCLIYMDVHWRIRKYSSLLITEKITRFLK